MVLGLAEPTQLDVERQRQEAALLARALGGDHVAFERLVRPHMSVMRRVAMRACGEAALAEDAVQEALVIAHDRLSGYTAGTRLSAWLAAIVSRRAATLARGRWRRLAREQRAASHGAQPATPEQLVRGRRAAQRVQRALAALPEKRRRAAVLRFDGGLSYAEIGEALGSSEASCRVLVYLAVKALKAELSDLLKETE